VKAAAAILFILDSENYYVRRNIQHFRVTLSKIYYKKDLFKNKDCRMNTAREISI